MNQNGWQKLWARRYTPYIASCYIQMMTRMPGFDMCRNKIFVPEGGLQALYFRTDEFKQLVDNYSKYILEVDLLVYSRTYEETFAEYLSWAQAENQQDWSKLTTEQIISSLKVFTDKNIELSHWQFFAFVILEGITKEVAECYDSDPFIREAIASPEKFTKITLARLELLDLVERGLTDDQTLLLYLERYSWLPIYEFIDEPLSLVDLKNQLTQITNPRAEREAIEHTHRERLALYNATIARIQDPAWKKKVEVTHAFSYLKEMRDDYRRPYYLAFRPFWEEIARRINLSFVETNYLLTEELVEALKNGADTYREEIKNRQQVYSLVLKDGIVKISTHDIAQDYLGTSNLTDGVMEIQGSSASNGCVRGRVNIINHKGEFHKFNSGDILVTAMTHPEFLLIMKQAAAIVTDEGGITCHAAIIAREIKKPCVIGTKIATKFFKDGDMVEVDADKGIVKKIN